MRQPHQRDCLNFYKSIISYAHLLRFLKSFPHHFIGFHDHNKALRVNLFHHFSDRIHLLIVAGAHHHFLLRPGIASLPGQDRSAPADIFINLTCNLLPLIRHDQSHLSGVNTVHDLINDHRQQVGNDQSVDGRVHIPEDHPAQQYDCAVQGEHDSSQGNMRLLHPDRHGHKIHSPGG